MSALTGRSTAAAIAPMRSTIRSRPIEPSSGRPAEKAIPALVVPRAGKPARAMTLALPAIPDVRQDEGARSAVEGEEVGG